MSAPNSLTIKIQWPAFQQRLSRLANTFSDLKTTLTQKWTLLQEKTQDLVSTLSETKRSALVIGSRFKKDNLKQKFGKGFLFIFLVVIVFFGVRFAMSRTAKSAGGEQLGVVSNTGTLTTSVGREFSFKVYDKNKKLADPVKYTITTAQLTKQIIIQGQKATAVSGRNFLIINLKLVNDYNDSLFLNTRNYIRVQPEGTQDKLAPEIHNDTVEVQPLSTKLTRVGLPVDEGVKNFTLYVGELEGEKTEIPISF